MIKVLIAEDSPSIAAMMREMLGRDPEIEIVGWAKTGREAVELRNSLNPDVITMDINMPLMNGMEATKIIASTRPVPILIVSQLIESRESELAFEALRCGAVDVMGKPSGASPGGLAHIQEELISRVKVVARVRPMTRYNKSAHEPPRPSAVLRPAAQGTIVAIGASTGGPPALAAILKSLPQTLSVPIAIVQHIAPGFVMGFRQWLRRECSMPVKLATNEEQLAAGMVYLAPDNHHLEIGQGKKIILAGGPPVRGHRPSADRLMESAAAVYGRRAIGVLLTGMGRDGADGLKKIREAGGRTIVQDEATSLVFGMPREAILKGAAEIVSPLDKIADEIARAVSQMAETQPA